MSDEKEKFLFKLKVTYRLNLTMKDVREFCKSSSLYKGMAAKCATDEELATALNRDIDLFVTAYNNRNGSADPKQRILEALANNGIKRSYLEVIQDFTEGREFSDYIRGTSGEEMDAAILSHINEYIEYLNNGWTRTSAMFSSFTPKYPRHITVLKVLWEKGFDKSWSQLEADYRKKPIYANKKAAELDDIICNNILVYADELEEQKNMSAQLFDFEQALKAASDILQQLKARASSESVIDAYETALRIIEDMQEYQMPNVSSYVQKRLEDERTGDSGLTKMHAYVAPKKEKLKAEAFKNSKESVVSLMRKRGIIAPYEQVVQDFYTLSDGVLWTDFARVETEMGKYINDIIVDHIDAYLEAVESADNTMPRTSSLLDKRINKLLRVNKLGPSYADYTRVNAVEKQLADFDDPFDRKWYIAITLPDYITYQLNVSLGFELQRYDSSHPSPRYDTPVATIEKMIVDKANAFSKSLTLEKIYSIFKSNKWLYNGTMLSSPADVANGTWQALNKIIGTRGQYSCYVVGKPTDMWTQYDFDMKKIQSIIEKYNLTTTPQKVLEGVSGYNDFIRASIVAKAPEKYLLGKIYK